MTKLGKEIDVSGEFTGGASTLIVFGLLLAGFFIGQFAGAIGAIVLAFANGLSISDLSDDINVLYDYLSLTEVLTTQVLYTIVFTFVTPWFYLRLFAKKKFADLSISGPVKPVLAIITVLATFSFMLVNAYVIEWNANIDLPDFLSGFEQWAKELEQTLAETTEKYTNFESFPEFIVGLIAISILPGIGEELLFRGVLQNSLQKWTKNVHIAIWVSAFVFSAIHMQFYGLVPRMLLGAMFGYLYVWSGSIWYAIIAHMANNGIAVIIAYTATANLDEPENVPIFATLAGLLVFAALMVFFKKITSQNSNAIE